jgi:phage FluMu protein Com
MAVLRCTNCGYLREVGNQYIDKTVACPLCKKAAVVHETVVLIQKLNERIKHLKQIAVEANEKAAVAQPESLVGLFNTFNQSTAPEPAAKQAVKTTAKTPVKKLDKGYAFANEKDFPFENNLSSLQNWFNSRHIGLTLEDAKMDISGYFDEVAIELGDNYALFSKLIASVKRLQTKDNATVCVHFKDYTKNEVKKLKDFAEFLYKCAFIVRYHIDRKTKDKLYLSLQPARNVVNFFNGDWLEWYVFMKVTSLLWERKLNFGYCRSGKISFENNDHNEIDLFFLIENKIPLWIECKSGEFRDSLHKYQQLRKRLNLSKAQAMLFVLGVSAEEAAALTQSFEITIVNESTFLTHLPQFLAE